MNTIEFKEASLWYGEVIALNEVSFTIKTGCTGLVGSNGAGKTSTIKLAASLLKPTLGEVLIDGEPIWQNYGYLSRLGYCPEIDRQFNFLTGRKFLDWAARMHGMGIKERNERIDQVLKLVGMKPSADRIISGYSRGMRQRIKIGQAILNHPQILLADEPLSGTDPIGRNLIIDIFKELSEDENVNIIISSHVLHELERISDTVLVLETGKLVAEGKISEVRNALSKIPQRIKIQTVNSNKLAREIMHLVKGIEIVDEHTLIANVSDRSVLMDEIMRISKSIDIYEVYPLDLDLTSIFKLIRSKKL